MTHSEDLFARAQTLMPGGVNSPVRAFGSVGGTPRFLVSAQGPYVTDADDRLYPRRALGGTAMLRGGLEQAGSDVSFLQAHVTARWYHGLAFALIGGGIWLSARRR